MGCKEWVWVVAERVWGWPETWLERAWADSPEAPWFAKKKLGIPDEDVNIYPVEVSGGEKIQDGSC